MMTVWRTVLLTVLLAFAAAYAGARLGAEAPRKPARALRESIYETVHQQLQLTTGQQAAIRRIDDHYEHMRNARRADIGSADGDLAQALANEMALGTAAQRALVRIQGSLGDMQRDSVLYVLDVRAVLTPEQQMVLDRKVFDTLAHGPL